MFIYYYNFEMAALNSKTKSGAYGDVNVITFNDQTVVCKNSQDPNDHSLELENAAFDVLSATNLPHIVERKGVLSTRSGVKLLYLEKLDHGTMKDLLLSKRTPLKKKQSVLFQSLMATEMMHAKTGISHNDLHCNNIMIAPVDYDLMIYDYNGEYHIIETHGYQPILIDFGFAYVPNTPTMMKSSTLIHCGYLPFKADFRHDHVRLLKSASGLLKNDLQIVGKINHMLRGLPVEHGYFATDSLTDLFGDIQYSIIATSTMRVIDLELLDSMMCQIPMPLKECAYDTIIDFTVEEQDAIASSDRSDPKLSIACEAYLDKLLEFNMSSDDKMYITKHLRLKSTKKLNGLYPAIDQETFRSMRLLLKRALKYLGNHISVHSYSLTKELDAIYTSSRHHLPESSPAIIAKLGGYPRGVDLEKERKKSICIYHFETDSYTMMDKMDDHWYKILSTNRRYS